MNYYHDNSVISHGIAPVDAEIEFNGAIPVGKFVDIDRPAFCDLQFQIVDSKFVPAPETKKVKG